MKTAPDTWTIREVLDHRSGKLLTPNPEYQRGQVWTGLQQQMLIDSLMRGFHLPIFYFHLIKTPTRHGMNTSYEIIDGQQRVNAIVGYYGGDFTLLDPRAPGSRFPRHLRDEECVWAGKSYDRLSEELQERFVNTKITVALIEDADTNEARDLFVRLQGGADLTPQERRDALPGDLGRAIVSVAGRRGKAGGHEFFQEKMGKKPRTDRGQTRQFAAQLLLVLHSYMSQRKLSDINKAALDQLYYDYMDLGEMEGTRDRLMKILDGLHVALAGWSGPNLPNHVVMHLVLMWQQFEGKFTREWSKDLVAHVSEFIAEVRESQRAFKEGDTTGFYAGYAGLTRSGADVARTIRPRHAFFVQWMMDRVKLVELDPERSFSRWTREYLYLKQNGRCAYAPDAAICGDGSRMDFEDAEVHHVSAHSKGGRTSLSNAAVVHRSCNRKIGAKHVPIPEAG